MIKIENVEIFGWEASIRGLRSPLNSWDKSDSGYVTEYDEGGFGTEFYKIGNSDLDLMEKLAVAGSDHSKFMRMINVTCDITAPLYWWSEYDTYKVGTVRNSCSKMHKLLSKPFEMSDFSFDKLPGYKNEVKQFRPDFDEKDEIWKLFTPFYNDITNDKYKYAEKTNVYEEVARPLVDILNEMRDSYLNCDDEEQKKIIWYSILQLLPESYNQRATVQINYAVLRNMYHSRKQHKLDEWRTFCKWIEQLQLSKLIIGGTEK